MVEHNFNRTARQSIWGLLHGNGYVRVQCIETDDIFVKLSILLQNEVRVDPRECDYAMLSVDCERILEDKDTSCWSLAEDASNLPPAFMDYIKTQESQICDLAKRRCARDGKYLLRLPLKSDMNAPRLKTTINGQHFMEMSFPLRGPARHSIDFDAKCSKYELSTSDCHHLEESVDAFLDTWLRNQTRIAVMDIIDTQFKAWRKKKKEYWHKQL